MKIRLFKLGAICIALSIAGNAMGQAAIESAWIWRTSKPPIIDGVAKDFWGAEGFSIARNWPGQTISMKDGAAPTWQACWDATATYVLVIVPDDHQYDHNEAGVSSWLADKPEIYFDINPEKLEDPALGASTIGSGHYQFAADFTCIDTPPIGYQVAFTIDDNDGGYIFEYAIPHAFMTDINGNTFSPSSGSVIGFDITILDLDAEGIGLNTTIGRANWSNDMLTAGESWVDMTMSGDLEYSVPMCGKCVEPPYANFFASKTDIALGESTQFTDVTNFSPTSWKWNFGDGTTSDIQNPTHIYNTLGSYTITLIASNGSLADTLVKENYINVSLTGIKHNGAEKIVKLMPNPSTGIFSLKVDKNFKSELSIQIIDASGKVVYTNKKISNGIERIDLSNYSKGIYFMQLSGSNYLQTEKLIVN